MQHTCLFIDAENVSARFSIPIMHAVLEKGDPAYKGTYGHATNLRGWEKAIAFYLLVPVLIRSRQPDATDLRIQQDMRSWFKQGIHTFFLVTHDGGYAPCIQELCSAGCSITLLGRASFLSHRLRQVCPTIVLF